MAQVITRRFYIVWPTLAVLAVIIMWYQHKFYAKYVIQEPTFDDTYYASSISGLKHILVWTLPSRDPIMNLELGSVAFIRRNCSVKSCFVSTNRDYFHDVTKFDVIVFHGRDISKRDLPKSRSPRQKYIYASMESSHYYPMCNRRFNDFFNWTWTYKLKSDENYGYINVWNKEGKIIGPKEEMHWLSVEKMNPINNELKTKLRSKKYAAAWFVSNCNTIGGRENIAKQLKVELKKNNLDLHIFGQCGERRCPRESTEKCLLMIQTDYYFYLSFENSFSEDYVTEKLLNALQNYAVPIVFGGANYTRFLPDGIYLDARKITVPELAAKMAELIQDKEKYYSYFKWHNHYSYRDQLDDSETDPYCKLCAMINDDRRFQEFSSYKNIVDWWSESRCNKI